MFTYYYELRVGLYLLLTFISNKWNCLLDTIFNLRQRGLRGYSVCPSSWKGIIKLVFLEFENHKMLIRTDNVESWVILKTF